MKQEICDLLSISEVSYYRWKKERKIFSLLEKYFSAQDLREFMVTGKIEELEKYKAFKEAEEYKQFVEFLKFQEYKLFRNAKTVTYEG